MGYTAKFYNIANNVYTLSVKASSISHNMP